MYICFNGSHSAERTYFTPNRKFIKSGDEETGIDTFERAPVEPLRNDVLKRRKPENVLGSFFILDGRPSPSRLRGVRAKIYRTARTW